MMKNTARLLLVGAVAASTIAIATPASACEDPRKGCGSCDVNPFALVNGGRVVDCPS